MLTKQANAQVFILLLLLTEFSLTSMVVVEPYHEAYVGLRTVNIKTVRKGAARWEGKQGDSIMSCFSHRSTLEQRHAAAALAAYPDAVKNNPGSIEAAMGIAEIAQIAEESIPDGCMNFFRTQVPPVDPPGPGRDTPYIFPGGFYFRREKDGDAFIVFLYKNMDNGSEVKWRNMTGQE